MYVNMPLATSENITFRTTIMATGYNAGVTTCESPVTHLQSGQLAFGMIQKELDSPTDQTGLIDYGAVGQMLTIQLTSKAAGNYILYPNCAYTGWNTITFDTVGDSITLLYLDVTSGWIVVGNSGCVIA
jgi:hypothetical protein